MKIMKIECIPVTIPYKKEHKLSGGVGKEARSVFIRIYTDEGMIGIADSGATWEWYLGDTQDSMVGIIKDLFGPGILLGTDPLKIENIVARMDRAARGHYQAKALIDFALHDIKGKKLGVPIYELLGGLSNEKIACGYVMSSETSSEMANEAVRLIDAGFIA
jgi:L-alanine-DL-glutamate epimerase-like enolase superfamily enzyme